MKHLLLSLLLVLVTTFASAQTRTISGTVRDASGTPMPGVAVMVPGTTNGTVTDIDGRYTLPVDSKVTTLSATFIGMKESIIDLAKGQTDAVLVEDNTEMDEVIVVAYGVSTKGAYTGSAAQVSSEELQKRQTSNVTQALSGTMAGVQTQSSNGQPGASASIRIRGIGSINGSAAPLVVLDGMPFDGDMTSINTADIESLTVLKDASSTALYGARGANGIIMITTKNGKKGDAKINVEARWGKNSRQIENYDVLTSPVEYYELLYSAVRNNFAGKGLTDDMAHTYANAEITSGAVKQGLYPGYNIFTVPTGETLIGVDGKINPNATLGFNDGVNYYTPDDWAKETFKENNRQQYDVSVSGGTDKINYFFSVGYLNDEGIVSNSAFRRVSSRLKVDYQAKKWLKVGATASYNNSKSRYPAEQTTTNSSGNAFFLCNYIAPIYPMYVRDANGNIMTNNGRLAFDYGDGLYKRNFMSMANPAGDLIYNKDIYDANIFNGSIEATITPISGLSLSAKYSFYADNTHYNMLANAYMGQSASYGGGAEQAADRTNAFDQQYIANYSFSLNEINAFDVTVGYDGYHMRATNFWGYGNYLYNPESYFLSNVSGSYSLGGGETNYATAGVFARVNYTRADKYFLNASFRRDSSSRFSEDNRWGNFWSVSAGWLINKEDFMASCDWMDMLKIKASYGEQGNDNIGNYYAWQDQYTITGANGKWNDATLAYKGNPDLTWENSMSWNAGVDFSFFKSRLTGTIEYFGRKSKDMLYNKPVQASAGYTSIPMNVGSMTNSGVEVQLDGSVLSFDDFEWRINANATFLKNEINELHSDLKGKLISGSRIYEEGESMYRLYLPEWAGVDESTGAPLWWAEDAAGNRITTDKYSVAVNYKKATEDLLPAVYGGFGTTINYKGFDVAASFAYQLGGYIYDSGYADLMHAGDSYSVGHNWHTDIRKAWTPENTKTDVPRLNSSDTYTSSNSTRFLTKSDYLALNNVTVGYTIPADLTRKLQIETVRVYFAADNVAIWTKREGLDPRQSFTSATTALYTPIRTVSGGVKITF